MPPPSQPTTTQNIGKIVQTCTPPPPTPPPLITMYKPASLTPSSLGFRRSCPRRGRILRSAERRGDADLPPVPPLLRLARRQNSLACFECYWCVFAPWRWCSCPLSPLAGPLPSSLRRGRLPTMGRRKMCRLLVRRARRVDVDWIKSWLLLLLLLLHSFFSFTICGIGTIINNINSSKQ